MSRRFAALIALLCLTGEARAHRLEAQAFLRPFGCVRIESWYETGDVPKAAKVEVFGPDNKPLTDGRLDAEGVFAFPYAGEGPLRVVVNAGAGHVATMRIKPEDLARAAADTRALQTWIACITPSPAPFVAAALLVEVRAAPAEPALPTPPRETGTQWRNLGLGLGILFAVGAAAMLGLRRLRGERGTLVPR